MHSIFLESKWVEIREDKVKLGRYWITQETKIPGLFFWWWGEWMELGASHLCSKLKFPKTDMKVPKRQAAKARIYALSTSSIRKGYNFKSSSCSRMQNCMATLEDSLVISNKAKQSYYLMTQQWQSYGIWFTQLSWKLISIQKLTHECSKEFYL